MPFRTFARSDLSQLTTFRIIRVTSSTIASATDFNRPTSDSHASSSNPSLGVLWRILRMTLRYKWQCTFAVASTVIACIFQLAIPRLLGNAVDQAQGILSSAGDAGAAEAGLWTIGLTLLVASILRGVFTLFQNYFGESVGHHIG